jgi:D-serine dehydratase
VHDIGLTNKTDADGLAVPRPSKFAGETVQGIVSGCLTVTDNALYKWVKEVRDLEAIKIEPSAAAGFDGPGMLLSSPEGKAFLERNGIKPENITHVLWTTGGRFVPDEEYKKFLKQAAELA